MLTLNNFMSFLKFMNFKKNKILDKSRQTPFDLEF
jgi:hypothetical protein